MATQSLLQIYNPVTKQYESVQGESGSINVTATISGGDGATETTLAAVENAVDGLEAGQTATNTKLDTTIGHVDQLEGYVDGLEGSVTTTATNTGTTATNTTAISTALASAEATWSSLGAAVAPTLKSGAGKIWTLFVGNRNASTTIYAWVYDALWATGTPIMPPVPLVAGAWYAIGSDVLTADGKSFATGLTVGFSTSRSTYSAHSTAADCEAGGFGE